MEGRHAAKPLKSELINSLIVMTTSLFVKSLLTSLCQREEFNPSLAKRGKGRFSDLYKFHFKILNKCILIKGWLAGFKACEVSLQKLFHHVCLPNQVRIWT
jgi:hypothetical protein